MAVLICGWSAVRSNVDRWTGGEAPATTAPPRPRAVMPSPSLSGPLSTVDGGPTTSFGLTVGTAARFTDQDGTWTVALLGVEWIDECEGLTGDTGPAVAFDIGYAVTSGAVSVIPLTDFTFALATGAKVRAGLLSTCAEPALDYAIISAGETRRGWIVVELPAGTRSVSGDLSYGQLAVPTASWTVPTVNGS